MRRFSSYGPLNFKIHYYAPRKELIQRAYTRLVGENPDEGGHYITVWAPRQCGKTWIMQQILFQLQQDDRFDVLKINLEHLKEEEDLSLVFSTIAQEIGEDLGKDFSNVDTRIKFQNIFSRSVLDKPLILIFDEFDALAEKSINAIVSAFRNIYIKGRDEIAKAMDQKKYLLHAVALIGVRSVLGIENMKGSPFNVQQSLHINNLTYDEVTDLFKQYEKESGQAVEKEVINRLFDETKGQPGLTCWFGELLTEGFEGYAIEKNRPINKRDFEIVFAAATYALPNNNILNIISKATSQRNKSTVIKMFQTDEKLLFRYDDKITNHLYMNGVIEKEVAEEVNYYIKFSCPFVQKRLFNYFSHDLFNDMGTLVEPFTELGEVITDSEIFIPNLVKLYQTYLDKNKSWLFKDAPRRSDLKIFEAVYHFNIYSYLNEFLRNKDAMVYPEFPTGNGKIDLLIKYKGKIYGLELKSYTDQAGYKTSLAQAAHYGKQLNLKEIYLLVFVPTIDEETRKKHEVDYKNNNSDSIVKPIFIETDRQAAKPN